MDAQRWSCSPLDKEENLYLLPALKTERARDSFLSFLSDLFKNDVEVYPVPSSLNCSGTVTTLEYCYAKSSISYGTNYQIFTLLTLEQNGLTFMISDMIDIYSTPTAQGCSSSSGYESCCDSFMLREMNQFNLPASNFAYGLVPSLSIRLLRNSDSDFRSAEHYSSDVSTLQVGRSFTVTSRDRRTDLALRSLQFAIGKFSVAMLMDTL